MKKTKKQLEQELEDLEEELAEQELIEELRCVEYFGNNLTFLRRQQKLTQKQVANLLCVSESTYANWEQGRREPNIYFIIKLTEVFNIDYNTLFDI